MLELCLAPLVMAGVAVPLEHPKHNSYLHTSAIVSAQTCSKGLGGFVKATTNHLYAGGGQYGWAVEVAGVEYSIKVQLGLSHTAVPSHNLPRQTQFYGGPEVNVCYESWCGGLSYGHMSNGSKLGLCDSPSCSPNVGEDVLAWTVGRQFSW